jgi:hypothetical protein
MDDELTMPQRVIMGLAASACHESSRWERIGALEINTCSESVRLMKVPQNDCKTTNLGATVYPQARNIPRSMLQRTLLLMMVMERFRK